MDRYPITATTLKTLDRFSYHTYSAISVNMLKYNHDTSATIRLLSTLVNTSIEIMEDLPYQISFCLKGLDFINIDRMNAFYWPKIIDFVVDENDDTNTLCGYSRYTDSTYVMARVEKQSDFIRHSLPVDSFFSGAIFPGTKNNIVLTPYIKEVLNYEIKDSQVTIYPTSGFTNFALDSTSPAKITIYGIDIKGKIPISSRKMCGQVNLI